MHQEEAGATHSNKVHQRNSILQEDILFLLGRQSGRNMQRHTNSYHKRSDMIRSNQSWCMSHLSPSQLKYQSIAIPNNNPTLLVDKAANNRFLHPTLSSHKIDTAPKLAGPGGVGLAPESPSYRECRQSKILPEDTHRCLGMACHICMQHRTNFWQCKPKRDIRYMYAANT